MKPSIYQIFPRINLSDRTWPDCTIDEAPRWCSIDLRNGDQSLPRPMSIDNKIALFSLLVKLGFTEIEVGSPGMSESDFNFVRVLIEEDLIPSGVTLQVMCQMKHASIDKTLLAIEGAPSVILHLYNTTSSLRRETIYDALSDQIITRAVSGVRYAKEKIKPLKGTKVSFQYSPEGFNTTEPSLLLEVCRAVIEEIAPTADEPMILNLLAATETDLPNYFADQIEWLVRHLNHPAHVCFSVQTHNDRGSAVAASELALLAGVTRVEGCLLGHGERAGSSCLLTMALNLYTQGIDPRLDFSDVPHVVSKYEAYTGMDCPVRHPYAGDLVFSAFSAPHQFAIREAYRAYSQSDKTHWHVPYLPMDPCHIGRINDDIIRLNALSGRTGIAHVMEKNHGYCLPKGLQSEFSKLIKNRAYEIGGELTSEQVWHFFTEYYFKGPKAFELKSISFEKDPKQADMLHCEGELSFNGNMYHLSGSGNGALDTLSSAIKSTLELPFEVIDYHQHALGMGSTATAVSYLQIEDRQKQCHWGVGVDTDATLSTLFALISALNRKMAD